MVESSLLVRFNPACAIENYICKTYGHITFPFHPRLAEWSLSVSFHNQIPVYISLLPIRAACHAHLILFNLINVKIGKLTANTETYT